MGYVNAVTLDNINSHKPRLLLEVDKNLVLRFPIGISQSSLGGKQQLSNACTLIALKIAELVNAHDIDMPKAIELEKMDTINSIRRSGGSETQRIWNEITSREYQYVEQVQNKLEDENNNRRNELFHNAYICDKNDFDANTITSCLMNGIIDGNEAYMKDAGTDSNRVYNLPDAIKACGNNFAEIDFKLCTTSIRETLPKMISTAVKYPALQSQRKLTFIMIGCIRTVLIVYDREGNSLTLFDTHMHMWHDPLNNQIVRHGALIGHCSFKNINYFVTWVQAYVFPDTIENRAEFEISLVQLTSYSDSEKNNVCRRNLHTYPAKRMGIFSPMPCMEQNIEEKENINIRDYPILSSLLNRPPLNKMTFGLKRPNGSRNGETKLYLDGTAKRRRMNTYFSE